MIELQFESYHMVESFFAQRKQYVPALSVIHGKYPGRVFVDQLLEPNVAIVWAISRWMYIEGEVSNDVVKDSVHQFIKKVVIPDYIQRGVGWFEMYTSDSKQWDVLFNDGLEKVGLDKHFESVYVLDVEKFKQLRGSTKPQEGGVQIDIVDIPIVPESYNEYSYVADKFKTMTTVGVEIRMNDQQLVSSCINNGLQNGNEYFVDVDTYHQEDRGKGYATLASMELIELLLNRGMYPLWETTHNNVPSHKLALKLGFEVKESYPVYAFILEEE